MKKKILAIVLSVVMLAALLVPMFAISAEDNPTITLYLDDPYVEGNVLWVPVYMSGNSEEMCAIEYKLYSLEKLTPRKLKPGTVTDSYIDGWGEEIPITFEPKGTAFPEYDGYSGFKVLNDAVTDVYNRGIKVDGGLIAIASFILPEAPGEYNFRVLGVSAAAFVEGANNKQDVKSYDIINGSDVMFRIECAEGEHVEKDVNVVAPDCDTPGSKDVVCSVCGKTLRTGETIPETNEHVDADNKWETNETQHFHTCSCGEIIDAEDHKGGEATCKDKAVCSVCNVAYGEKNATNHAGGTEVRGYDAPSCNEPGYTGDTYCLGCNEKLEDGEPIDATGEHVDADNDWETNGTQHFHTCACGTEFDKEDHFGGEANCKDKAVCSVCNVAYGEIDADNHDFSGKVTIKEEPTSEKGGKYTVECVNGCGNSDERDSKKLANSIEDKEAGVTIKSDEAILPEDITLTIDESTAKEEDGKYSVTFNFTSQLVNTLSGKAEFALSLEDTDDMDNIQISVVNADGTTTVISEIKDGKLVFSADLDGTYVLSFTDKVEDEKKEETPKTSDSMNIAVVVLVALVAAAGLAVVGKKRIAL